MGLSKEIILTVKDYEIKLNRDIKFYENDTIDLCFSILEYGIEVKDGVAVNKLMPINALKAYMLIETPQGVDYAESTKVENNRVVFNLGNKYSQFIGIGKMQIVIKDNDGCRITLPEFPFEIRQSINSNWDKDITVFSTQNNEIIIDEFGRKIELKKISEMEEANTLPINSYSMILDNNENKKIKTNLITQKIENDLQLVNEQLDNIENEKRSRKEKITSRDMDISSEENKLGLSNFKEEVIQAIAGNASIESTVANKSIVKEKLADDVLGTEYNGATKFILDNIYSRVADVDLFETFNVELLSYENDQIKYNKKSTGTFGAIMSKYKSYNMIEFKTVDNNERLLAFAKNGDDIYTINTGLLTQESKGEIRRCNLITNEYELLGTINFNFEIDINDKIELSYDKNLKIIKLRSKNSFKFNDVCQFYYSEYIDDSYLHLGFVTTNANWSITHENVRLQYVETKINNELENLKNELKSTEKVFKGKSYCSIGDSITWQDGNKYVDTGEIAKGYQTIVKEVLGFSTVINQGKSGWTIVNMCNEYINGNGTYKNSINSADVISLFTCTNDFQLNTPLGTNTTSYDVTTFTGATNIFLRELVKNNIGKPILCIATPQRKGFRKDGETDYSTQQTNNLGVNIEEYVNRFIDCCKYNGIPCLDLFHTGGINKFNVELLTRDGLHPIDKGYEVIGYKIAEFIKNNR